MRIQAKGTAVVAKRGRKPHDDDKVRSAIKVLRTKDMEIVLDHIVVSARADRSTVGRNKAKHRARITSIATRLNKEVAVCWTKERGGWVPVISKR